jgi:hypothetical protein
MPSLGAQGGVHRLIAVEGVVGAVQLRLPIPPLRVARRVAFRVGHPARRPVGVLVVQTVNLRLSIRLQFGEVHTAVVVATQVIVGIEWHAAVVADRVVLVIHPVFFLRGELVPEVVELAGIGRRIRHLGTDVRAVLGRPGRVIARHGQGAGNGRRLVYRAGPLNAPPIQWIEV